MSNIKTYHDIANRCHQISGHISDKDLVFYRDEIITSVKRELVSSIVDHLMERLTPQLDKSLIQAFTEEKLV